MAPGVRNYSTMNLLMLPGRTVFVADTYVNYDPSAEQLADMTSKPRKRSPLRHRPGGAAFLVVRYRKYADLAENARGVASAQRARTAPRSRAKCTATLRHRRIDPQPDLPEFAAQGTGQPAGDADLSDAANISFNLLRVAAGDRLTVGPILLGRMADRLPGRCACCRRPRRAIARFSAIASNR